MRQFSSRTPSKHLSKRTFILAAAGVIIVLAVFLLNWNLLRGPLSRYVSHKLGRDFAINGDLRVELSTQPLIEINDVTLGNAAWGSERTMARARRVVFRIDLGALLKKRIVLPQLELMAAQLLLEKNRAGKANWEFGGSSSGAAPEVRLLKIEDGVVRYRDPVLDTDVKLRLVSEGNGQQATQTVGFTGEGRLRNQAFTVQGHAESLLSLRDTSKPYFLQVQARTGDTAAQFAGKFVPRQLQDIDGKLSIQGNDLSQLHPLLPTPLPWTPAYQLTGYLTRRGDAWSFHQFTGKVGASDIAGEFSVDKSQKRPSITAQVTSQRLNYKDLGGFVGLPPATQPEQKRTAQQRQETAKRAASSRVLPDKPYDLERLRAVDAVVQFRGQQVVAPDLPLDNLTTHLELKEGMLTLKPLDFGIAGGHVVSNIVLNARAETIRTSADISVKNVELKKILPQLKPPKGNAGKLGGRARLASTGNSIAQMLGAANGEVALIMAGGQASALTLVLTNLDLARAAQLLLGGDENAPIHCLVAQFSANHGDLKAETFVLDTAAENISGAGHIDLRNERLDLRLRAESKRPSPLALGGPIAITGSFKHPSAAPEIGAVAGRTAAAAALGAIGGPLGALLPLIDTGGAKDSDCRALITQAEREVGTTDPHRKRTLRTDAAIPQKPATSGIARSAETAAKETRRPVTPKTQNKERSLYRDSRNPLYPGYHK